MRKQVKEYVRVGDSTLVITGNVVSESAICISGKVDGNIMVKDAVRINDDCAVTGNVNANVVTVDGTVKGNIMATKCIVSCGGKVFGDIHTDVICIDEGGVFNGNCTMKKSPEVSPITSMRTQTAAEQ